MYMMNLTVVLKLVVQLGHIGQTLKIGLNAANDGYQVNNTPSVGSIMQSTPGPYGHVA